MLLELQVNDFCYSADNYNMPQEKLYIFCKEFEIDNWGIMEKVKIYIKVAIKENEFIVIISFHKPEKNIEKYFINGGVKYE